MTNKNVCVHTSGKYLYPQQQRMEHARKRMTPDADARGQRAPKGFSCTNNASAPVLESALKYNGLVVPERCYKNKVISSKS